MSLSKVTYVDGETIIGASNLNAIQDAVIALEGVPEPYIVVESPSGTTFVLDPCPTTYAFGEKAALNVTVTATTQYHFSFESPSGTPTVLSISGISGQSGDSIEAGKRYEVDVWGGIALIAEVGVVV